jgi:hypothetical protein
MLQVVPPESETCRGQYPKPPGTAPRRILAVWTRELDNAEHVGRINVARKVRDVLQEIAPVVNRRLTNAFEETGRGWSLFL